MEQRVNGDTPTAADFEAQQRLAQPEPDEVQKARAALNELNYAEEQFKDALDPSYKTGIAANLGVLAAYVDDPD